MSISTRKIVVAGVLIAVAAVLALTRLAYFPVPNITAAATILHVPAIIGSVLEGPVVGLIVGLIFGFSAWTTFAAEPYFVGQPAWVIFTILFIPRLLVGIGAWLGYVALRRVNEILALAVAGIVGSFTNTIFVIGLAILFGIFPAAVIIPAALPQALFEAAVAAVLTVAVVSVWKGIERGRGGARI